MGEGHMELNFGSGDGYGSGSGYGYGSGYGDGYGYGDPPWITEVA